MPSPLLRMTAVLAGLVAVAAQDVGAAPAAAGNFTETCTQAVLQAGRAGGPLVLLRASCRALDDDGGGGGCGTAPGASSWHSSALDLDLCIGIDYTTAALAWSSYGKFSTYCADCHVQAGTLLACACATLSGVRQQSTIDLDSGISNRNGTLACQGAIGT